MIARDAILAEAYGAKLHIAHVSSRGSVDIIRAAKERGVQITCETAPHYISDYERLITDFDSNARVNPPLRSKEDMEYLQKALSEGVIDAIATDHAPHNIDEKRCEFANALSGLIGLETAFSLCATHLAGIISKARLAELLCAAPRKILGIGGGTIEKGQKADIALVNFGADVIYDETGLYSKARNTPFLNMPLKGRAVHTFVDGRWVIRDGVKIG